MIIIFLFLILSLFINYEIKGESDNNFRLSQDKIFKL